MIALKALIAVVCACCFIGTIYIFGLFVIDFITSYATDDRDVESMDTEGEPVDDEESDNGPH